VIVPFRSSHEVSLIDPARHPRSVPAWALGDEMPQIGHRLIGIVLGKKALASMLSLSAALISELLPLHIMTPRRRETSRRVTLGQIRGHGCRDLLVYCESLWCSGISLCLGLFF
jgi:hypothetical protein